jgi:flagellar basal body-associated protein FliL
MDYGKDTQKTRKGNKMSYLLFVTAILLSSIAAFYAVVGLMSIFAASAIPIAIMGGTLEAAKLVVASWLYRNWKEIPALLKIYFTSALVILMLLTSMGIFGYLSKAHLDQAIPTGDVVSKLEIIDQKITTQKENVNAARKALAQLDSQVDQTLSRTNDDRGAERSVQIRRSQTKERTLLIGEIQKAQEEIARLNNERAPIAAEVRKVEAEVGPIKYIAALIYGDNPGQDLLEKAVRWVIILIVLVFDPLAVLMLIAWNREKAKNPLDDPGAQEFFKRAKEIAKELDESARNPVQEKEPEPEPEVDKHAYLKKKWIWKVPGVDPVGPMVAKPEEPHPQPKLFDDWDDKIYKRAEIEGIPVPEQTKEFLDKVEQIKEEPLQETKIVQTSEFSAKEDEFTLSPPSDTKEIVRKPISGRPSKYK